MSTVLCGQQRNLVEARLVAHAKIRLCERTTLTSEAVRELLAQRKYVPLRIISSYRRGVLIYSESDDCSYVVLQNYRTKEVITILPLEYWTYDDLTENSAEAWQARYLVLGDREHPRAPEEDWADLQVDAARSCQQAHVDDIDREKVERYIERTTHHLRLREALTPLTSVDACQSTESEALLATLAELSGEAVEAGKPLPTCSLVLKVLRQDPYVPVKFRHQFVRPNLGEMLVDPSFVAAIIRKMTTMRLLDEDILGVHLEFGTRKVDLCTEQSQAFFSACVDCIEMLSKANCDNSTDSADVCLEEAPSPAEAVVEATVELPEPVVPDEDAARIAVLREEAYVPVQPCAQNEATYELPSEMSGAAPAVLTPTPPVPVAVKPVTEFEQLLVESGWAIRRPADTHRSFRAA